MLRVSSFSRRVFSSSTSSVPWFVDTQPALTIRQKPPHLPQSLPENIPASLGTLHAVLSNSPHLEPSTLQVREPIQIMVGPRLPYARPKGRRKRGGSYFGEGVPDVSSGIWNWIVLAQVKDGTERRGAIESVVRVVRKTLLGLTPPLPLPPNSKRRMHNGWAMIDAGQFAVHVLSREAREKYFTERKGWDW